MENLIEIIQGDSLELEIEVESGIDLIDKVFFSSGSLNLVKEAIKVVENGTTQFFIRLSHEETKNLRCCHTTYDITVILFDDQVKTTIYKGELDVLKKDNKIYEN